MKIRPAIHLAKCQRDLTSVPLDTFELGILSIEFAWSALRHSEKYVNDIPQKNF